MTQNFKGLFLNFKPYFQKRYILNVVTYLYHILVEGTSILSIMGLLLEDTFANANLLFSPVSSTTYHSSRQKKILAWQPHFYYYFSGYQCFILHKVPSHIQLRRLLCQSHRHRIPYYLYPFAPSLLGW